MRPRLRDSSFWLALVCGIVAIAYSAYLPAKAWVAQQLLETAWSRAQAMQTAPRPWPWADTVPVARLRQTRLGIDQIVLAGASGRVLAFGPGHVTGTTLPGGVGNTVISAHRDTHFRWLQHLRVNDVLWLETINGEIRRYVVKDIGVHDQSAVYLLDALLGDRLTLLTCFPFVGVDPGTPLRYVITALPQRQ
jgi:sortase A